MTAFKTGQVWLTRGGQVATIEFIRSPSRKGRRPGWPVLVDIEGEENEDLYSVGLYGNFNYPGKEHRFDLVKLIKDAP